MQNFALSSCRIVGEVPHIHDFGIICGGSRPRSGALFEQLEQTSILDQEVAVDILRGTTISVVFTRSP
jgi:hypothetical protein